MVDIDFTRFRMRDTTTSPSMTLTKDYVKQKLKSDPLFDESAEQSSTQLWLVSLSLSRLDADAFKGLSHLTELFLSKNYLTKLDGLPFDELKNLQRLYVNNNQVRCIDMRTFRNAKNLRDLNLAQNQIDYVDPLMFNQMDNLKILNLSKNIIRRISISGLFPYTNKLILQEFHQTKTPNPRELIKRLVNFELLNLESNKLYSIDSRSFVGLENMTTLNLAHNQIQTLDAATFKSLPRLTSLDLSYNHLKSFEAVTFQNLECLRELYLNDNHLTLVDGSSFCGVHLVVCHLKNNCLRVIDGAGLFKHMEASIVIITLANNFNPKFISFVNADKYWRTFGDRDYEQSGGSLEEKDFDKFLETLSNAGFEAGDEDSNEFASARHRSTQWRRMMNFYDNF
jgi:Leucine-rich repeat (LRR) protein